MSSVGQPAWIPGPPLHVVVVQALQLGLCLPNVPEQDLATSPTVLPETFTRGKHAWGARTPSKTRHLWMISKTWVLLLVGKTAYYLTAMPAQLVTCGPDPEVDEPHSVALSRDGHQVAQDSSCRSVARDPSLLATDRELVCRPAFVCVPHLEQPVPAGGEEEPGVKTPGHAGNVRSVAMLVGPAYVQGKV